MKVKLAIKRSIHYILLFLVIFFLLYSFLNIIVERELSGTLFLTSLMEIALPAILAGFLYSFFVKREQKTVPIATQGESLRKCVLAAISQMDCRICGESDSRIAFCHRSFWERIRYIFDDKIQITIHSGHLALEGRSYLINQFFTYLAEESGSNTMK